MILNSIALACFGIWLYLLLGRGQFWRSAERDDGEMPPAAWPAVAAIVPARNEADCIAASIGSLLRQDYAGAFTIILVDDGSQDATAAIAKTLATGGAAHSLTVVTGRSLPSQWTGKLWAVKQGVDATD